MKTRIFVIVAFTLVFILGGLLVNAAEKITLTIPCLDTVWTHSLIDRMPEWEAKHPDVKIRWDLLPFETLFEKQMVDLSMGTGNYDVIFEDQPNLAEFAPYMVDITPFIEKYNTDIEDFVQPYYDYGSLYKGKRVSLSIQGNALIMFYRKDLFDEAGIGTFPLSWAKVKEAAEKLTVDLDSDGKVDRYGYAMGLGLKPHMACSFFALLRSFGGEITRSYWFHGDDHTPIFNSRAGVRAIEWLKSMVPFMPIGYITYGWEEITVDLQQDRLAFALQWNDIAPAMEDITSSKIVGKMAYAPAPRFTTTGGWFLGLNSATPNKEQAYKFAEWMTVGDKRKFALGGGSPNSYSVYLDPEFVKELPVGLDYGPAIVKALETGRPRPGDRYTCYAEMQDIIEAACQEALLGKKTPKGALDGAATEIARLLKRFGYTIPD